MSELRFTISLLPPLDSFDQQELFAHIRRSADAAGVGQGVGMEIHPRSHKHNRPYAIVTIQTKTKLSRAAIKAFRKNVSVFHYTQVSVNLNSSKPKSSVANGGAAAGETTQNDERDATIPSIIVLPKNSVPTETKESQSTKKKKSEKKNRSEGWEQAKCVADLFFAHLQANPIFFERASDREELGLIFQDFLVHLDENVEGRDYSHPHFISQRRVLEATVMTVLRTRKLARSKRYNDKVVMVFAQSGKPGDFPPLKERQSTTQRVLQQKQAFESNKNGVVVETITEVPELLSSKSIDIGFQVTALTDEETVVATLETIVVSGPQKRAFQVKDAVLPAAISGNNEYPFQVNFCSSGTGVYRCTVVFTFRHDKNVFEIARFITLRTGDVELQRILKPTTPYEPKKRKFDRPPNEVLDPPCFLDSSRSDNPFSNLSFHSIPLEVEQMVINRELETALEKPTASSVQSYSTFWKKLLWASELQAYEDIKLYDMEGVKLHRLGTCFVLNVPGLAEGRPSVLSGDVVHVTWRGRLYKGRVVRTRLLDVQMELHSSFHRSFDPKLDSVDVRFTFSRMTFRICHEFCALGLKTMGQHMLFPMPEDVDAVTRANQPRPAGALKFANMGLNQEQKAAVVNIVEGRARPLPYIVFGPPGTGKTTTIVEAVYQLARKASLRTLLVAPSNDAADVLVEKLATLFPPSEMCRVLAYTRSIDQVSPEARPYVAEGLTGNELGTEIMRAKVVVATINYAARFTFLGVERGHFDVLFVDEAGHATEPEVVSVAASLMDFDRMTEGQTGQLILAGDPKQLGPVVTSNICRKFGMGESFLERLTNTTNVYGRKGEYNDYPSELITKLVRNYRSHPDILKLPNEMFYDGDLINSADILTTHSMARWEYLPARGFPIIFHSVHGENLREGNSPSWFNPQEAEEVVRYVELLTRHSKPNVQQKDIGVITPYARQAQKIRQALQSRALEDIKVGSVETFQGQERRCIILSTVRAETEFVESDLKFNLGFVANEKRFNVAVTRAKALLIVIGHPKVLSMDKKNWLPLLDFCRSHGGWAGEPWDEVGDDDADDFIIPSMTGDVSDEEEWDLIQVPSATAVEHGGGVGFIHREE